MCDLWARRHSEKNAARWHIVHEILETEENYVGHLRVLSEEYSKSFMHKTVCVHALRPLALPFHERRLRPSGMLGSLSGRARSWTARQGVSSTSALTLNQFVDLFGKVQSVVVFNQALLDKIRRRVGEWSDDAKIGDIFLDASTEMRIYTHYVNNYSRGPCPIATTRASPVPPPMLTCATRLQ